MMKKIAGMCLLAVLIPYVVTLAWTGRIEGGKSVSGEIKRTVVLDRGAAPAAVDLEEYLIGVTALQIPASYEEETLKAQAVIARTYLCKQMGDEKQIAESALDLDYLEESRMEEVWGQEHYLEYYRKIRDAVQSTGGQVITCDGVLIDPLFHRISAGQTRDGDDLHPYLRSADGHLDVEAENYITLTVFTREDFAARLNGMGDPPELVPEQALESIQIVEKDGAGYVTAVQAGSKTYGGEEIKNALGLPSCAFSFEDYEGNIRCVTKGIGHGYGFDQYGADLKAKEGWKAEELLKFYYKNIIIISE